MSWKTHVCECELKIWAKEVYKSFFVPYDIVCCFYTTLQVEVIQWKFYERETYSDEIVEIVFLVFHGTEIWRKGNNYFKTICSNNPGSSCLIGCLILFKDAKEYSWENHYSLFIFIDVVGKKFITGCFTNFGNMVIKV